jgi:hypothetical protein
MGGTMIQSAGAITLNGATDTAIKSAAGMTIEAKGNLILKGTTTRLNDGTKPVATVGSAVATGRSSPAAERFLAIDSRTCSEIDHHPIYLSSSIFQNGCRGRYVAVH